MSFKDTPIICSPYEKPRHYYALGEDGQPTGEMVSGRRKSMYLVPVPLPRRRAGAQRELILDTEGASSRVSENHLINEIRRRGFHHDDEVGAAERLGLRKGSFGLVAREKRPNPNAAHLVAVHHEHHKLATN